MKTFSIQVQSLNERDGYLVEAGNMTDAIREAIVSFQVTHCEIASSLQAEQTSVDIGEER